MLAEFEEVATRLSLQRPRSRSSPASAASRSPRAGDRPRLLGLPRAPAGALRRRSRGPRHRGAAPTSSSAPTRSSARWPASAWGTRTAPLHPNPARGQGRARDPDRRPRHRPRPGAPVEWKAFFAAAAPRTSPCPPTPSSASATGSHRRAALPIPAALGQRAVEHPFLAAAIEDPEGEASPSAAASPSQSTPGWPTTPSWAPCSSPAPPSWSWPSAPVSKQAARASRS